MMTLMMVNAAQADGKLIGTSGVSSFEGSGGGGFTTWAMISGYATGDEFGGAAFISDIAVDDYEMQVGGVAVGIKNRLELGYARQRLEISASGQAISQNIFSAKYRLFGDVVYSTSPQVSLGVQHKRLADADTAFAVGAASDSGTDIYLAVTKAWLDGLFHRTTLVNLTARATKANQVGALGFGSVVDDNYDVQLELAAGLFFTRRLASGIEYRQKPDKLGLGEEDWKGLWLAYFVNKRVSLTASYIDLGSIAGLSSQRGSYLSMQLSL